MCVHYFLQTNLLNQWTGYLVSEALIPANQISTDDFAGALANQTKLAIKGVIGIQAMSVISGMLGDTANEQNYSVRDCCPTSALTWTDSSILSPSCSAMFRKYLAMLHRAMDCTSP
jgi:hypothetical protein